MKLQVGRTIFLCVYFKNQSSHMIRFYQYLILNNFVPIFEHSWNFHFLFRYNMSATYSLFKGLGKVVQVSSVGIQLRWGVFAKGNLSQYSIIGSLLPRNRLDLTKLGGLNSVLLLHLQCLTFEGLEILCNWLFVSWTSTLDANIIISKVKSMLNFIVTLFSKKSSLKYFLIS